MTTRIAINGLGRIGKSILRAIYEYQRKDIEVVAVNGTASLDSHLHTLTYDSVHGTFPHFHKQDEQHLLLGETPIRFYQERDPSKLSWAEHKVDVVLECTGQFTTAKKAAIHLEKGAKKVIISAPGEEVDSTIVYGVNHHALSADHRVISIGSCTTNCLAPIASILEDALGIEYGYMTTIHAYTNDQNILDGNHKDLRRGRACALSMIPASTGAAHALGLVLPTLVGKLNGSAVRVPTPNVSMIDLSCLVQKDTSVSQLHHLFKQASNTLPKGVLRLNTEQLVSIDFNHDPHSAILDLTQTHVIGKRFCRLVAWYDNEWAFSVRMLDVAAHWMRQQ